MSRNAQTERDRLARELGALPNDLSEVLGYHPRPFPPGATAELIDEAVARHEAAHAFVYATLGLRFDGVRLSDDGAVGVVYGADSACTDTPAPRRADYLAGALAGLAANVRHGYVWEPLDREPDAWLAWKVAAGFHNGRRAPERRRFVVNAFRRATELLSAGSDRCAQLAAALRYQRDIPEARVCAGLGLPVPPLRL